MSRECDLMRNDGLPVVVVWPSVVLFSTPCSTTSGLISTDAPQSSTPAFNEEGTRTHTAPTYDRRKNKEYDSTDQERARQKNGALQGEYPF